MSNFNLETEEDILKYLDVQFPVYAGSRAEKLAGGNTNYTFRIFLRSEISVSGQSQQTIILKHAKPFLARDGVSLLSLERQVYEVAGLRYANKVHNADSLAKAPTLLEHDATNYVILMSDAGVGSRTLKDLLISNELYPTAAAQVGSALGEFLAKLHEHGRSASDRETFSKHQWGKQLVASFYYARVVDTLAEYIIAPPIELSEQQFSAVKKSSDSMISLVQTSEETILMGDFWTGNVVVQLSGSEEDQRIQNILVADWELSRLGAPGKDIGQFAAEVYLPRAYYPACSASADTLIDNFCSAYKSGVRHFDEKVIETANRHIGTHFIIIATRFGPWCDDKAKSRLVAEEGVSYLSGLSISPTLKGLS